MYVKMYYIMDIIVYMSMYNSMDPFLYIKMYILLRNDLNTP
jgi:hypothetical protein